MVAGLRMIERKDRTESVGAKMTTFLGEQQSAVLPDLAKTIGERHYELPVAETFAHVISKTVELRDEALAAGKVLA
jgi:hypothetical protein